jgi:hypothetical protein
VGSNPTGCTLCAKARYGRLHAGDGPRHLPAFAGELFEHADEEARRRHHVALNDYGMANSSLALIRQLSPRSPSLWYSRGTAFLAGSEAAAYGDSALGVRLGEHWGRKWRTVIDLGTHSPLEGSSLALASHQVMPITKYLVSRGQI